MLRSKNPESELLKMPDDAFLRGIPGRHKVQGLNILIRL